MDTISINGNLGYILLIYLENLGTLGEEHGPTKRSATTGSKPLDRLEYGRDLLHMLTVQSGPSRVQILDFALVLCSTKNSAFRHAQRQQRQESTGLAGRYIVHQAKILGKRDRSTTGSKDRGSHVRL